MQTQTINPKPYVRNNNRNSEKDAKSIYILRWAKRVKAVEYKGGKCIRCGEDRLITLVFHHKNGQIDKEKTVCDFSARRARWDVIRNEIDKCDLLCENCHREEHKASGKKNKRQNLNKLICLDYKGQDKCAKCGYKKCSSALEFHHKKDDKIKKIVEFCYNHSWKSVDDLQKNVIDELNKCEILCSNCHKVEHFDSTKFNLHEKEIREKSKNLSIKNKIDQVKVIELGLKGMTPNEISIELNCSRVRAWEILSSNGINNKAVPKTRIDKTKIEVLWLQGLNKAEIRRITGNDYKTMSKIIKEYERENPNCADQHNAQRLLRKSRSD